MPRTQRSFTGVVILTRTKEELKEALEALTEAVEGEPQNEPPLRGLKLVPRERAA